MTYLSFQTSALHAEMNSTEELARLARHHSLDLKCHPSISPFHFLMALMQMESSLGENNVPRFEDGYSRRSIAFKRSKLLREGYDKWGDLCAMSYGPCQILWIVARELNYGGHPLDLWSGIVSMPYCIALLNQNFLKGADTLEKLAASYNGGANVLKSKSLWPEQYVKQFTSAYAEIKRKYSGE